MTTKLHDYIKAKFTQNGKREGYKQGFIDGIKAANLQYKEESENITSYVLGWADVISEGLPQTITSVSRLDAARKAGIQVPEIDWSKETSEYYGQGSNPAA